MSAAAELRAAAQRLLDLADETDAEIESNNYWHSARVERPRWFENGIDNAVGGPAGLLAGLMSPAAARAVATWLRKVAKFCDDVEDVHSRPISETNASVVDALEVARALNPEVTR